MKRGAGVDNNALLYTINVNLKGNVVPDDCHIQIMRTFFAKYLYTNHKLIILHVSNQMLNVSIISYVSFRGKVRALHAIF